MIFDTLDGRTGAPHAHRESAFGKEYDSLADMPLSFGVAPAIVAYQWGVVRIAEFGHYWGRFGWLACFFYVAAAALRLALQRARKATADKRYFEGVAESICGRDRGGVRLVRQRLARAGFAWPTAFAITASAGALMQSRFSYPFQQFDLDQRIRFVYLLLVPVAFILIGVDPPTAAAVDVR